MLPRAPWRNCHPESIRRALAVAPASEEAACRTTARTGPGRRAPAADQVAVSMKCRRDKLINAASFRKEGNLLTRNLLWQERSPCGDAVKFAHVASVRPKRPHLQPRHAPLASDSPFNSFRQTYLAWNVRVGMPFWVVSNVLARRTVGRV